MGFKKEVTQLPQYLYSDVRCDRCDRELKSCMPHVNVQEDGRWECLQPFEALEIDLIGFYGGYFDTGVYDGKPKILLCKLCADVLVQQFPCFKKAIDEQS